MMELKMNRTVLFFLVVWGGVAFSPSSAMSAEGIYPLVGAQAKHTVFANSIEDLPVMLGLDVVEDKDVFILFGAERIAQTTLKGKVDVDDVYYFYRRALPELGWKQINAKAYERGGERLLMQPSSANKEGMTYVRFSVEPVKE
ncbi:MAG TPA: hypothetical protein DD400_05615 [Rhodospirillaceae bacterium]|nr:hypothetical protein [Rhodospirillaceae bacterium]